tara:strand:- start:342 stop:467 length:126 start_codon:yes stop_codon:yes gene_type:complete
MDYLVGFIFGFFINKFVTWLDRFATPNVPEHYTEDDWDWIV